MSCCGKLIVGFFEYMLFFNLFYWSDVFKNVGFIRMKWNLIMVLLLLGYFDRVLLCLMLFNLDLLNYYSCVGLLLDW